MRAQKVVRREAGAEGRKLDEGEILSRVESIAGQKDGSQAEKEKRLGDMLESLCALAEAQGLDAETALRAATARRIESIRAKDEKSL